MEEFQNYLKQNQLHSPAVLEDEFEISGAVLASTETTSQSSGPSSVREVTFVR